MHTPVLLKEVLKYLDPKPGAKIIDATLGDGGHAMAIVERILPEGKLLGIEIDRVLFEAFDSRFKNHELRGGIILINDSYINLKSIAEQNDFTEANGILFDLGMSSWHIDESGRGFTFQKDEPLDMRFSSPAYNLPPKTASEIVNRYSEPELAKILREYGEERFARSIAGAIVGARRQNRIETTFQLVEIVKSVVPFWYRRGRIHFATRTFQALRIAVNDELNNIQRGLEQAVEALASGGRIAVISFHSLEDRIVKNFFRSHDKKTLKIITKKPITASGQEVKDNPRARSAKLRVAEKIKLVTNP